MKFPILFAFAFALVSANDLYSPSIIDHVLQNEGRITNGQKAAPEQFKYLVGLSLELNSTRIWCSGSLIHNDWVLSAAHCTVTALSVLVYFGATKFLNAEKICKVEGSDNILTHPAWNPSLFKNDISLIRIPTTNESSRIGFVKIPSNNDNKYLDDSVVVAGWGYTSDNATSLSDDLHYGILKVSPKNICLEKYSHYFSDDVRICVATPNKVSTCGGDSGAPLVLEGQNIQIGVYSFGDSKGCAKKSPIVFTRVSAYRFWIKTRTGINY